MSDSDRDRDIPGVPCWVDTTQPDPDAAVEFYGGLFGWELEDTMPPDAPGRYFMGRIGGRDVAAVSSPMGDAPPTATWNTYVWVGSADDAAAKVREAGGTVLTEPFDVMESGRMAVFADPAGAVFCVWQANQFRGAQVVNEAGSLNFNDLNTRDLDGARAFYGAVFGWEADPVDFGGDSEGEAFMWRLPGYGDFLAIRDPDIKRRHAEPWVPRGFSDAIGWMAAAGAPDRPPSWDVTFSVDGTDAVVERAVRLGGTVVSPPTDQAGGVVRVATIRDPQDATFSVGTFDPSAGSAS